jgi:hypothetical protein
MNKMKLITVVLFFSSCISISNATELYNEKETKITYKSTKSYHDFFGYNYDESFKNGSECKQYKTYDILSDQYDKWVQCKEPIYESTIYAYNNNYEMFCKYYHTFPVVKHIVQNINDNKYIDFITQTCTQKIFNQVIDTARMEYLAHIDIYPDPIKSPLSQQEKDFVTLYLDVRWGVCATNYNFKGTEDEIKNFEKCAGHVAKFVTNIYMNKTKKICELMNEKVIKFILLDILTNNSEFKSLIENWGCDFDFDTEQQKISQFLNPIFHNIEYKNIQLSIHNHIITNSDNSNVNSVNNVNGDNIKLSDLSGIIEIPIKTKLEIAFKAIVRHGIPDVTDEVLTRATKRYTFGMFNKYFQIDKLRNPATTEINDVKLIHNIISGDHFNENNLNIAQYVVKEVESFYNNEHQKILDTAIQHSIDHYHSHVENDMRKNLEWDGGNHHSGNHWNMKRVQKLNDRKNALIAKREPNGMKREAMRMILERRIPQLRQLRRK